jgi:hypothetical protein
MGILGRRRALPVWRAETSLQTFHRNPKVWEKYRDENNLLIYGTANSAGIRLADKEHRRRHRRRLSF